MIAYAMLMRPLNCLMTAVAVLIGGALVAGFGLFGTHVIYAAMVAAFLIAGAGNAINDYVDVDADKVNKPSRPIPSGKVSRRAALYFSAALFLAGVFIAYTINTAALAIAVFNSLLLVAYAFRLKERMLIGNASTSYLVGSGFLFGGAALGNLALAGILFLLASFANMGREIAKDLEDIKGDRLMFLKKLAKKARSRLAQRFNIDEKGNVKLRYRPRVLSAIGAVCILVAVSISPLPYTMGMLGLPYLAILVPADFIFLCSIFLFSRRHKQRKDYARISKAIKLAMFIGLLAFLAGALV